MKTNLLTKVKEAFLSHIVSACVAATLVLTGWFLNLVASPVWKAITEEVAPKAALPLLLLSLLINLFLLLAIWYLSRKPKPPTHRLLYGILWDPEKNPCCPKCRGPVAYGDWSYGAHSYRCPTCEKLFELCDSDGQQKTPAQALAEL